MDDVRAVSGNPTSCLSLLAEALAQAEKEGGLPPLMRLATRIIAAQNEAFAHEMLCRLMNRTNSNQLNGIFCGLTKSCEVLHTRIGNFLTSLHAQQYRAIPQENTPEFAVARTLYLEREAAFKAFLEAR